MSAYFLASRRVGSQDSNAGVAHVHRAPKSLQTRAAPSRRMAAGNHYTGMPATAGSVIGSAAHPWQPSPIIIYPCLSTKGDVVQALAAAHAALCNNSAITLDDAVLAIWLYEESMVRLSEKTRVWSPFVYFFDKIPKQFESQQRKSGFCHSYLKARNFTLRSSQHHLRTTPQVSRTGFSLLGLSASPTLLRSGLHAFGAPTVVDNFAHFRHRLLRFLPSVPGATIE